jgi:hypothetical protein
LDAALIRQIRHRAGGCCEYCHMPEEFTDIPFEIDHIIARKHDGATVPGNLALSCFRCNAFKGSDLSGRDPRTRRLTPLFNPRRHKWTVHFRWAGAVIVGRTPIGRTTASVLKMNDPFRVALREELFDEGVFPPAEHENRRRLRSVPLEKHRGRCDDAPLRARARRGADRRVGGDPCCNAAIRRESG